jgi:hypothetical protein
MANADQYGLQHFHCACCTYACLLRIQGGAKRFRALLAGAAVQDECEGH